MPKKAIPVILVVEDDAAIRKLLELTLPGFGMQVRLASTGNQAIDVYRKETIDLVLLDVQLQSEPDGPTTLQELRKINPEVKALFMSGNSGHYSAEELLAFGAKAVLQKPLKMDSLRQLIVQLIG